MIGEKIKELCDRYYLGHKIIANSIGMSAHNLYKIYKKDSIESKHLINIASVLQIPIGALFHEGPTEYQEVDFDEYFQLHNDVYNYQARISELESIIKDKQEIIKFLQQFDSIRMEVKKKGVDTAIIEETLRVKALGLLEKDNNGFYLKFHKE
jgi:hypothetical protein